MKQIRFSFLYNLLFSQNKKTYFSYLNILLILSLLNTFTSCKKSEVKKNKEPLNYEYYVSVNGDDKNPGTFYQPFKTIQKAVNEVQPGETICIMEGEYKEKITIRQSGNENNYITIRSYPEDIVVINGIDTHLTIPSQALIRFENAHFIKLKDLKIINSTSCGIYGKDGSSNITIEKCQIKDCMAPGICFGADFIAASNIRIIENHVENCAMISREAISLRTVDNFEIAHNTVKNILKESIDVKSGCKNGSIHNNRIINAGLSSAIYLDAGYYNKPINDGQYNIHVYQNIIENPRTLGIAVASEMGNSTKDIYIYNNLIYDLYKRQGSGIKVADHTSDSSSRMGYIENIYIYNNTIYGRAQQGIYVNIPNIKNIIIRNNISVNNWIAIKIKNNVGIDEDEVIIENNLLFDFSESGNHGVNSIIADPHFINIQNACFELKSSSPAIDNGSSNGAPQFDIKGISRPQGNGYDIGAYEFTPQVENL